MSYIHLNLDRVHKNSDDTFTITDRTNRRILKTHTTVNQFTTESERRELVRRIVAAMRFCHHMTTDFLETHMASDMGRDVWEAERRSAV